MKKVFRRTTLAAMLAIVMLLTACGGGTGNSTPSNTDKDSSASSNTDSSSDSGSTAGSSTNNYIMGTAGSSGAYYIIGAGIANVINNRSASLRLDVQATSGGGENVSLVDQGEMDFGWVTGGSLYCGYYGTGFVAPEDQTPNLRAVMRLHVSFGQMLARKDSGITTYADLKGKKVCLGTTSPEVYDMSISILRAYGIDYEKDLTAFYLSQDEGAQKLADGDIDATFIMAGIPTALFTNLTTDNNYVLVNADPDILEQSIIDNDRSYNYVNKIPAGTYPNIDYDVWSYEVPATIFCRADLPDEDVYEFCKQVYENWETIMTSHASLEGVDTSVMGDVCGVPLHPGAEQYYREIGLIA